MENEETIKTEENFENIPFKMRNYIFLFVFALIVLILIADFLL